MIGKVIYLFCKYCEVGNGSRHTSQEVPEMMDTPPIRLYLPKASLRGFCFLFYKITASVHVNHRPRHFLLNKVDKSKESFSSLLVALEDTCIGENLKEYLADLIFQDSSYIIL